ncbi:MAG: twin-arginine translocation signal domain-containing protein, partial [Thermoguttaceae bacterium]|nr:twin-arginine translocation signal domain-containing protein [Thermoguttaceae bacterium]
MALNRRQFLKTSALSAAALGVSGVASPYVARANNASSKLNIAVIGIGGRGAGNINELPHDLVNIAALCDVDENTLASQG